MAEIKAINKTTVHQICSGQVVLDLATAVKELVENSLDAKATTIEIKLKEYGSEQVEVCDNGIGVKEENFQALTMKHYTSKLSEFSDLSNIGTFGFRGEALSSLCALCNVVISTKHKDASIGCKLEYDTNGKIVKKSQIARQTGTTVYLNNIFYTLPVRHKEYHRNIKKEYGKLLTLLNAYCVISTNVRLSCCNQTKGRKVNLLATQGASDVKQNIVTVFGSKQFDTLIKFEQESPNTEICEEYSLRPSDTSQEVLGFKMTGWVSGIVHGSGRSSPDRQFFFINSRPVDISRLSKLVNEVYHVFNRHQYPFVVLNIEMSRDTVDVNVTPDKRQVFLQGEKPLLATVKSSLLAMFTRGGVHAVGTLATSSPKPDVGTKKINSLNVEQSPCGLMAPSPKHQQDSGLNSSSTELSPSVSLLSKFRRKGTPLQITPPLNRKRTSSSSRKLNSATKLPKMESFLSPGATKRSEANSVNEDLPSRLISSPVIALDSNCFEDCVMSSPMHSKLEKQDGLTKSNSCDALYSKKPENAPTLKFENTEVLSSEVDPDEDVILDEPEPNNYDSQNAPSTCVRFSMESLRSRHSQMRDIRLTARCRASSFQAKILPGQNSHAEKELTRNLDKGAFKRMVPLGQFNLGFVIAKHDSDLFIVDQHASDEIYNFETLQRSTDMHTQKLVVPHRLQLTAADKLVLVENIHIFRRNGFDFDVGSDAGAQQDDIISLTRVPMSKNWDFGSSDVEELIFMLSDAPGVACRPSRVRNMFASRACRKSVMIGTALNMREMRRILDHMSDINQPWNCPHGRPTMRHLVDLSRVSASH